jgi:protein gp37
MSDTNIGWTDKVWNPTTGCSKVSEGCRNCYAESISLRYGRSKHPWSAQFAAENVVLHPDRLSAPLHWRKPAMCFVNSMSDLFHEQVPDEFIASVFVVMWSAPRHTFQVLTKRPQRMAALVPEILKRSPKGIPANVWLGTSVEDQRAADERIPYLMRTPAAVRFLSCEPLLGPVDLHPWVGHWIGTDYIDGPPIVVGARAIPNRIAIPNLGWLIGGGESGPGHRRMDLDWLASLVKQSQAASIPMFVKQDSGQYPGKQGRRLEPERFPGGRS